MDRKQIKFIILVFQIILLILQLTSFASAAPVKTPLTDIITKESKPLEGVFGEPVDIRLIVANIIKVLLTLLGILYLCYVVYGGFVWMTAAGNEDKIQQAKSTILTGAIGVGVILTSFAVARLVVIALGCSVQSAAKFCLFFNNLVP